MASEAVTTEKFEDSVFPRGSLYLNSFKAGLSAADVFVIIQRNGEDLAVLNMSYTVAKSLGEALSRLIADLEKKSGRVIMTSNDVAQVLTGQMPPEKQ